jgi:ABC-type nitrate/sulfonate/bicarbonate transport system permease component
VGLTKGRQVAADGARTTGPVVRLGITRRVRKLGSVVLLLVLWEVAAFAINDSLFLPSVDEVVRTLWRMTLSGELAADAGMSLLRALGGFSAAVLLGVPLGVMMGTFQRWDDFWGILVSLSNPVPKIALVPLFMLWLGIGEQSKIAVIAAGAFFPILINTYAGVRGVNAIWIWRARSVGVSQLELLAKVILPAALPSILTGARLGMALAWVVLVAAEMVASRSGLGFRILYGQQMFETNVVFAGIVAISVLGFAFDRIIQLLSQRACRWHFRIEQKSEPPG